MFGVSFGSSGRGLGVLGISPVSKELRSSIADTDEGGVLYELGLPADDSCVVPELADALKKASSHAYKTIAIDLNAREEHVCEFSNGIALGKRLHRGYR